MSAGAKQIDGGRVAIYIRWSTDDQGDGTTLEVQLDGCRHYLLSQGWQVSEELTFVDDGYSGGNLDRPALTRLRQAVKFGRVDCVVVFKVDRLSRSVIDTVNLVLEEWDGRTHLKSAREPIDTTTAMGKQFFYLLVSYAEWERSVIRERTVAGRRRRAQEGYKPSAIAPYGYRHSPIRRGALEVVETEAEIVREIFRLCNAGLGAKAIAGALNAAGTPHRNGGLWSDKAVLYMLRNPAYAGDMVYGKTARNPRYGKEDGAPALVGAEPVVVENSAFIPPLIEREVFQMAQQMRLRRRRGPGKPSGRANSSPYLLSGLARCRCGYGLYVKEQFGARRKTRAFNYCCIGKRLKGPEKCACAPIPMAELDAEIEQRVRDRFGREAAQEAFLEQIMAGRVGERRLREAELAEVDRRLGELGDQEKKVRRDYRTDRIAAEEYRELKSELEQEAAVLRERRQEVAAAIAQYHDQEREGELVQEQLSRVDQWERLTPAEKKSVLRFFIDTLVAYRRPGEPVAEIDVTWLSAGSRCSRPCRPAPAGLPGTR
ncbi:MAG TPA: recombinase family protein [Symbiobacteriaceae bacterium]|nr:recombinase family protein [Symbiobacteriaceae bacterium]